MRTNRWMAALTGAVALTAGIAASAGVFLRGSGATEVVTSTRGETYEMATDGVYAYNAMREPRAYRPALDTNAAAEILLGQVTACRLDREVVAAVLDVVGARSRPARTAWPRELTDREVEVLRLLARGRSNKEIASALGISPRTAQHHVIHIYRKIERNSRAGAALFATEHGLLDPT